MACECCGRDNKIIGFPNPVTIEENHDPSFSHVLCDDDGFFLRVYKGICSRCGLQEEFDFTLDGDPYIPVGDVSFCEGDESDPTDTIIPEMEIITSGGIWSLVGEGTDIRSITLIVQSANGANTVDVTTLSGTNSLLLSGTTLTWAIDSHRDIQMGGTLDFTANGTSSAIILWTYIT